MEQYTEITWPAEFSELKTIEKLLKCEICYDYMDTPVITPCSHNYCSLCIRKYLHYKTRCPLCFQELFENQLNPNRILEEILINFAKVRNKLHCLVKLNNNSIESGINQSETYLSQNSNQGTSNCVTIEATDPVNKGVDEKNEKNDGQSNNCETFIDSNKLVKNNNLENNANSLEVKNEDKFKSCPVCQVNISEKNIDKHIDICTKREASIICTTSAKKRPQLPKLVLNLMKDSELKKKLKEVGLPIKGVRKVLEARYQRYCTIYNAECDKKNPRSAAELLKQCNNLEKLEKSIEPLPLNMRSKK
ncbi:GSCOCG00009737001-RA-CDS [Cotesia congregata]|nr:GSCOCG00009737001-RA-CDS [Cotesia congregata]